MAYKDFREHVLNHLGKFNKGDKGTYSYKGVTKSYQHILAIPDGESKEDVIKQIINDDGFCPDLFRNPQKYAHHLNSSQVVCYEFFRDKITDDGHATAEMTAFLNAIGIPAKPFDNAECQYEYCPDEAEYTNFDFYIEGEGHYKVYFEIKYTENGFGSCKNDEEHTQKFNNTYKDMISNCACLKKKPTFEEFRKYYQLFRNVLRVTKEHGDNEYVVFLFPEKNTVVQKQLHEFVAEYISDNWKQHVLEVHWEELTGFMKTGKFKEKFFPTDIFAS